MDDVLSHDNIVLAATTTTPGQLKRFIDFEAAPASYYRPRRSGQIAFTVADRLPFVCFTDTPKVINGSF